MPLRKISKYLAKSMKVSRLLAELLELAINLGVKITRPKKGAYTVYSK